MMVPMSMQPTADYDPRLEFDQADRIRRALRIAGLPVSELADYLGVTRGTVSSWINGRISPSIQSLRLIALRTGVPYEWLRDGWAPWGSNPRPADYQRVGSRRNRITFTAHGRAA